MKRTLFIGTIGATLSAIVLFVMQSSTDDIDKTADAIAQDTPAVVATEPDSAPLVYPTLPAFGEDKTEVCADCHPDHVDGFKATGMGKSLYPMTAEQIIESWTKDDSRVSDPRSGLVYTAYRDAEGRFWQEETFPNTDYLHRIEASLAIGSAHNTRSYLGWSEGSLVQLPLTYYVDKKKWDLSPGYRENNQRMNLSLIHI